MTWTQAHNSVPFDDHTDAHGQISARLEGGAFNDAAEKFGHSGAWTADDTLYALTHALPGGRSIMAGIVAYLYASGQIGQEQQAPGESGDAYPGRPDLQTVFGRLEGYGFTVGNAPYAEKLRFAGKYYENALTPANDAEWMARERGLYWLPETYEAAADAQARFRALERAIGAWGLSGTEPDREAALAAYFALEAALVPAPGEVQATPPSTGALVVNPRRCFYWGRRIENKITQGSAWEAAVRCTGLDWQIGLQSVYAQHAMQTYPLEAAEWRAALGRNG